MVVDSATIGSAVVGSSAARRWSGGGSAVIDAAMHV